MACNCIPGQRKGLSDVHASIAVLLTVWFFTRLYPKPIMASRPSKFSRGHSLFLLPIMERYNEPLRQSSRVDLSSLAVMPTRKKIVVGNGSVKFATMGR